MSVIASAVKSVLDWINPAKPAVIIKFPDDIEKGTPKFLVKELEDIIARGNAQKMPIFIISITGVLRSGKSFLLNLMKTYLDYYNHHQTDKGWENSGLSIEDGRWAKSKNSVTHGIWVWDQPFIINGVAVLLMDCQGTGDHKMSSPTLDNLILYMGLQLANVQILNLKSVLQSSDLERLDLCADYAEADCDGKALFDSLIFLIRDWEADDIYGEKREEFDEIIEEARAPAIKKFGEGIKRAFRSVNTYALPHPGTTVIKCSDQDQKIRVNSDCINEEYLKAAKELFNKLFVRMPNPAALLKGRYVIRKFRALRDRTIDSEFGRIKIQTAAEAFEESLLNHAFIEATDFFDDLMTKAYDEDFADDDHLERFLNGIVDDTIERFMTKKTISKYQDSPAKKKYLDLLNQKRHGIQEKKAFIIMTKKLKMERDSLERKVNAQQKDVEDLKAKHKRLAAEALAENIDRKAQQGEMMKRKQVQAETNMMKQQQLAEKEANLRRKQALTAEQEKIRQHRRESEERTQREEEEKVEGKKAVLAEAEKARMAVIKEKENLRDKIMKQAEERMKDERRKMEELAEKLRIKNEQQDDIVPEEKWIGKAEEKVKGKGICIIL